MIVVAGASGNVGGAVVRELESAGHGVRALVRSGSDASVPAGAERAEVDLNDRASLRPAFAGVDAAFLLAGYPDMPGVLADLADAGAGHVVLLSTGAVVGGDLDNAVVRFNMVSEIAVRDCGLSWTVLRPSGFMSNTLQWVSQLRDGDQVLEPFADVPISVIDPADIAAVAAVALATDGHDSRSYRLTGPDALLPADRARILGEVLGRSIELTPEPDDAARRRMATSMPEPVADAFFQFFRRGGYDDSHVNDVTPRLLNRAMHTFRDWAEANTDAFH
ncbi:MAG: NAD(P)H-binding protein [Actinomycetota bacterium]